MRMIRRNLLATATCCLAVAGAAPAQTEAPKAATLGKPQAETPGYVARGAAPNPGYPAGVHGMPVYPRYVPREYVVPTPPTYGTPGGAKFAADQELAQTDKDKDQEKKDATPAVPMPMPPGPGASTLPPTAMPPSSSATDVGTVVSSPVVTTPFLDGQLSGYGLMSPSMPTVWVAPEFLYWRSKGAALPQVVTTAPAGSPGTLGDASTTLAFGGRDVLDHNQAGWRIRAGWWFDHASGIDVAFFCLGRNNDNFDTASGGNPGIFLPFRDTVGNVENTRIVAFDPGTGPILSGRVSVTNTSDLMGGEVNYRTGFMSGPGFRFDWLCGFRYVKLHDVTTIETSSTALPLAVGVAPGTRIGTFDRFEADNRFYGGQVGVVGEWDIGCVTFGVRATVAAGVNCEKVKIDGSSGSVGPGGARVAGVGGLFAQPSNIGEFNNNRFSILPEVGVTLGYQVTNNLRVFGGYNLLYWTDVVRAAEQIDRTVTSTQIVDPVTGIRTAVGGRPSFTRNETDYFSRGWTAGLEWRW
jgi:Putative beta barrel porin-7 (BBP7)